MDILFDYFSLTIFSDCSVVDRSLSDLIIRRSCFSYKLVLHFLVESGSHFTQLIDYTLTMANPAYGTGYGTGPATNPPPVGYGGGPAGYGYGSTGNGTSSGGYSGPASASGGGQWSSSHVPQPAGGQYGPAGGPPAGGGGYGNPGGASFSSSYGKYCHSFFDMMSHVIIISWRTPFWRIQSGRIWGRRWRRIWNRTTTWQLL